MLSLHRFAYLPTAKRWIYSSGVRVLCVIVGLLNLFLVLAPPAHAQQDLASQVLERINQVRSQQGLAPLMRNPQLDAAAQAHADDLSKHGAVLGHRGSDGSTIEQRTSRAGYGSPFVGENWAAYRTLDQSLTFWLQDPPHRSNLLSVVFRDVGIGIANLPGGGYAVVADFGSPDSAGPALAGGRSVAAAPLRPTAARPRATAKPKPTVTPTRKLARKATPRPTRAPTQTRVLPTFAALAQSATPMALGGRGRAARFLAGEAQTQLGAAGTLGDPLRMGLGAALSLGGTVLLGASVLGERRRRFRG